MSAPPGVTTYMPSVGCPECHLYKSVSCHKEKSKEINPCATYLEECSLALPVLVTPYPSGEAEVAPGTRSTFPTPARRKHHLPEDPLVHPNHDRLPMELTPATTTTTTVLLCFTPKSVEHAANRGVRSGKVMLGVRRTLATRSVFSSGLSTMEFVVTMTGVSTSSKKPHDSKLKKIPTHVISGSSPANTLTGGISMYPVVLFAATAVEKRDRGSVYTT